MKQKKVYLFCGPPASGKSTWIQRNLKPGAIWISRDFIRFSIVNENEDYFSHETEVFKNFIDQINYNLINSDIDIIYIDATHINKKSRNKTLNLLNKNYISELNCICFTTPKEVCLERNSLRKGRSRVPDSAIHNMFKNYKCPNKNEEFFNHLYLVNGNGSMFEVEGGGF